MQNDIEMRYFSKLWIIWMRMSTLIMSWLQEI